MVDPNQAIVIRNLSHPGAMEIINNGPDIDLAWKGIIQQQVEGKWHNLPIEIELIEGCEQQKKSECLHFPHASVLRPVPWTGYSCASQCNKGCRANVYLGPGLFRFGVASCDGKNLWFGPIFKLEDFSSTK